MISIFIQTFGCSLNVSDSEVMAGLLEKADFKIVHKPEEAALIIINSCNVKGRTQNLFFSYLEQMQQLKKPIIVGGCIPKTLPARVAEFSLISPDQLNMIVEVVEETLNGNTIASLADGLLQRLNLPKVRRNPVVEIVPISKGCLGSCSYCIVKKARGSLASYPAEEILKQARDAIKDGVKEIWVTSQDSGCYGKDSHGTLPELLQQLCSLEGDFRIRLGMLNPHWALEYLDRLVEVYRHQKMFKFLHIPVQSGSNEILKRMNRRYTKEDFISIVQRFKKEIPGITIATDVICGFPGETKAQFEETLQLIRTTRPVILNISRFSPRPGTQAVYMSDQLSGVEIKSRSRTLTTEFEWIAFEENRAWKNWVGGIIIDEQGKNNTFVGRNNSYKPVIVEGNFRLGQGVKVKIAATTKHDLRGIVQQG